MKAIKEYKMLVESNKYNVTTKEIVIDRRKEFTNSLFKRLFMGVYYNIKLPSIYKAKSSIK